MKTLRRVVSLFLVTVLLLSFPLTAFAAPAAVPSVSEYIFDTLLSANGVDTSLSGVQSWLGSWTGYDDYWSKESVGNLGHTVNGYMTGSTTGKMLKSRQRPVNKLTL